MMSPGMAWQRPSKQFEVELVNRSVMRHGRAIEMVIHVGGTLWITGDGLGRGEGHPRSQLRRTRLHPAVRQPGR